MVAKRKKVFSVRVGRLTILLPREMRDVKAIDIEKLFNESGLRGERRSDVLIVVGYGERRYALIIEDTGLPEPKDFERLREMERRLRDLEETRRLLRDAIVVKIVHHTGLRRGKSLLKRLAASYRVELIECGDVLDLQPFFKRIGG